MSGFCQNHENLNNSHITEREKLRKKCNKSSSENEEKIKDKYKIFMYVALVLMLLCASNGYRQTLSLRMSAQKDKKSQMFWEA